METELDVIESLNAIDYEGKCVQEDILTKALDGGPQNEDFRELVAWLTQELHVLRKTDERVSADVDPSEFAMELSAMLKELGCQYQQFVAGPLSHRFETREACLLLLEYLITELMATKMSMRQKHKESDLVISKFETNTAKALEQLARDLCLGKPPNNIQSKALFDKLNFKVEELLRQVKPGVVGESLLRASKSLTDAQWQKLDDIHADLDAEYNMRRQVLLTRLEVTIQSFQWSDSMKTRENEIISRFQHKLKELEAYTHGGDDTNIVALLAAREDLAIIEKTSSANVRKNTATDIQKHVIGSVPDRGGRAHEHAPPPPEMPSWQQQRASGPGGGGRGGHGSHGGHGGYSGGGRGGRGGNSSGGDNRSGGNWQQYSATQQQPYQQRPQFEQGRDQNWISGSGRVQGTGWSQHDNNSDYGRNDNGGGGGGNGRGGYSNRGRSNYNRGGGSGGGGGGSNYNNYRR